MKYSDYKEHRQHGTYDFPFAFYHVDPSHQRYNMPYHWHTEYEIIRIINGEFLLTLNDKKINILKNQIIFIHDGVLHGGIPENCVYECIVFDMKSLFRENNVFGRQIQNIIKHRIMVAPLLPADSYGLQNICHSLFEAMAKKEPGYELITLGSLFHLIGIVIENELFDNSEVNTPKIQQRLDQFKNVLAIIEQEYAGTLTLNQLSRAAGMSSKYFCRFFRDMTQRTPIDYLNYFRIESSCELIVSTNDSITDIALNCGFNDLSYFIKTFKRYKGITPKQYALQFRRS